ncbi:MAG: glycosyltransferase [Cellulosilyticaceae bacterium]
MKCALLTMFNGLNRSYSLVSVVAEQIEILLSHHLEVKLLVSEQCPLSPLEGIFADPRIEWCFVTNNIAGIPIKWHDYSTPTDSLHTSFPSELHIITESLMSHLQDVDICIMHDILYQGWHYIHNIAIRQVAQKLTNLHFIAFTHSFPLRRPLSIPPHLLGFYTPMPRTRYVYPTYSGITALSTQYQVPEGHCHVVYNSLELLSFLSPEVRQLHERINLYDTDLLIIYPARLTPSKQLEKVVTLVGSIYDTCEKTAKIIFCDFPSLDVDPRLYKDNIRQTASTYNFPIQNIIFTSEEGFPSGLPRQAVLDLFSLSNLFICPSFSESFGLTVLEAASRGNFLVLNECVPALEELSEKLHPYLMRWPAHTFEGDVVPTYTPSEKHYYQTHAKHIVQKMLENEVLVAKNAVRLYYSQEWIWHHQLAPLLNLSK